MGKWQPMTQTDLLRLIESDELLVAPGVCDGLTASIVAELGYEAIYLGGYATGAATAHTEPMITMSEMVDRAREITSNVDRPVIVDGNAGFGDPAHTYRSVKEYAKAGIGAIHIEDQVYPKRLHYHAGIKRITDAEAMVEKVNAADQSRIENDLDIVLIARSDAARAQRREYETIDEAIRRVNLYLDAGADAAMVFPANEAELRQAVEEIEGPMVFTMHEGREPNLTTDELDDIGVAVSLNAISATVAIAKSIRKIYTRLREEGHTGLDMDEFQEFQSYIETRIGLDRYYEIEERTGKK